MEITHGDHIVWRHRTLLEIRRTYNEYRFALRITNNILWKYLVIGMERAKARVLWLSAFMSTTGEAES